MSNDDPISKVAQERWREWRDTQLARRQAELSQQIRTELAGESGSSDWKEQQHAARLTDALGGFAADLDRLVQEEMRFRAAMDPERS